MLPGNKKLFRTIVTINTIIATTLSLLPVVKPRCNCKIKTSSLQPWTQFQRRVLAAAGGKFSKFDVTIRSTRAPPKTKRERESNKGWKQVFFSTKNRRISNFLSLGRKVLPFFFYFYFLSFLSFYSFLFSFFFHSFPATDEGEKIGGERRKDPPLDPNFFPPKENANIPVLGSAILFLNYSQIRWYS